MTLVPVLPASSTHVPPRTRRSEMLSAANSQNGQTVLCGGHKLLRLMGALPPRVPPSPGWDVRQAAGISSGTTWCRDGALLDPG